MSIKLSNDYVLDHVVASGGLEFGGKGWLWDRPLIWLGLIDPSLFIIFGKSITYEPKKGKSSLVEALGMCFATSGRDVNKVGLTNPGFDVFMKSIVPHINFRKTKFAASLFGTKEETSAYDLQAAHRKSAACCR